MLSIVRDFENSVEFLYYFGEVSSGMSGYEINL